MIWRRWIQRGLIWRFPVWDTLSKSLNQGRGTVLYCTGLWPLRILLNLYNCIGNKSRFYEQIIEDQCYSTNHDIPQYHLKQISIITLDSIDASKQAIHLLSSIYVILNFQLRIQVEIPTKPRPFIFFFP